MSIYELFPVLLIVVSVIIIFVRYRRGKKDRRDKSIFYKYSQNKWLQNNNITVDVDYSFESVSHEISARYIVDINKKCICLSNSQKNFDILRFTDVNGIEIMENSDVIGGIERAIVGGILAGGAGAVVGAATAKSHVMSYQVVIYTKKINNPKITLTLINSKESKIDSINYQNATDFANNLNASIKSIVANQDN